MRISTQFADQYIDTWLIDRSNLAMLARCAPAENSELRQLPPHREDKYCPYHLGSSDGRGYYIQSGLDEELSHTHTSYTLYNLNNIPHNSSDRNTEDDEDESPKSFWITLRAVIPKWKVSSVEVDRRRTRYDVLWL